MSLRQKDFTQEAGERAVLWIDPARVDGHTGTKWPVGKMRLRQLSRVLPKPILNLLRPTIKRREPFVIPRACFGRVDPVVETERYLKIIDFIRHKETVTQSAWYQDLTAELARTGTARHKDIAMTSEAEILKFLHGYVGALVDKLAADGFSPEHGGYESTAVIGPDGGLTKAGSGNHRFNIAKALGLTRFPLRIIAVHEDWLPSDLRGGKFTTEGILRHLPAVEAAHRQTGFRGSQGARTSRKMTSAPRLAL